MHRDLRHLSDYRFDLLVIGGGIYGACIAWDATLRGLSVALVEKCDFGHATSANSQKTVHGGLRYLQHLDVKRMRESIRERMILMRIAPHLVHPLPCVMPVYGHGMKGREMMAAALLINDLISCDRNRLEDPQKKLPNGRVISRQQCLDLLSGIDDEGLTGGAIWYDAQMYNSERLTLSFVSSAESRGARVANYVEAVGFLTEKNRVVGIEARDGLSGDVFPIRAKTVVNAAGPWVDKVLHLTGDEGLLLGVRFAKAVNVAVCRLFETYAVGISSQGESRQNDAVANGDGRLLFISPWRNQSLIGTTYTEYATDPDDFCVTDIDIQELLDDVNGLLPSIQLTRDDVQFVYGGLVPISGVNEKNGTVRRAKHYRIRDHHQDGFPGLISVLGVKYTTARDVAQKVIDRVFRSWNQVPSVSNSDSIPVDGGKIEQLKPYVERQIDLQPFGLNPDLVRKLVYNYGTKYSDVLHFFDRSPMSSGQMSDHQAVLRAQVLYAIEREMAQKLSDVVLRRTDLGPFGFPDEGTLKICLDVMGEKMGWNESRIQWEVDELRTDFAFITNFPQVS